MGLVKALIMILDPNNLASVTDLIPVQFNPEEYSLNKDNNFASQAIPGLSSPILQFVNGNLRTLEMELFFDTLDDNKDVRTVTDKIAGLLKIDPDSHAPPILRFVWASLDFTCVSQPEVYAIHEQRSSGSRPDDRVVQRVYQRRARGERDA